MNIFGKMMYGCFIRLGQIFYSKIAIKSNFKACHFAESEWHMIDSMESYMKEEDYIKNTNERKNI